MGNDFSARVLADSISSSGHRLTIHFKMLERSPDLADRIFR